MRGSPSLAFRDESGRDHTPRTMAELVGETSDSRPSAALRLTLENLAVAAVYFVLAKGGLQLASINPSATPVWPPTGFALAAVLLWGYGVSPGIWIGASGSTLTARPRERRT